MKIEGTTEERSFYEGLSKIILNEATTTEIQEFMHKIINTGYNFAGKGDVNVLILPELGSEYSDTVTAGMYMHLFNTIFLNNQVVEKIKKGEIPFAELLITGFHERRHASQHRAGDVVRDKPELEGELDKMNDEFFSAAVKYLKSEVPPRREDIKSFYSIFQYSFPLIQDKKEKEKFIEEVAFGFYLGSAHEVDARRQSIIEAYRFLEYIYDDMAGVPVYQDWVKSQMGYLKTQLAMEQQKKVIADKAKGFYNIDVSESYLLDIVQKIEDVTAEYTIQSEKKGSGKNWSLSDKSNFEWVCEKCLKKFFETKSTTELSNYYAAMLANPAVAHRLDKEGLVYETYDFIVADRVLKNELDQCLESASEEEKEYLSNLMLSVSLKSPLKYEKFSEYFNIEDCKKFFVYGANTKCGQNTFFFQEDRLDLETVFDPANKADREMVDDLFETFRENYSIYYDEATEPDIEERCRRQIITRGFDIFYFDFIQNDSLKKLMKKFGYEKEFEEIMNREDKAVKYDEEIFNRVRKTMGQGLPDRMTVEEYYAQTHPSPTPLLGE